MRTILRQILRPKLNQPILDRLRLRSRFCFSFDQLTKIAEPIIRVNRDVDLVEIDIGSNNNNLDIAALQSFIGSSGASVSIAYDRSGNNNHAVQGDKNRQLRIAENGVINIANNKPFLRAQGAANHLDVPLSAFVGMTSGALVGVFRQGVGGGNYNGFGAGGIGRFSNSNLANHLSWIDGNAYVGFMAYNRYTFPNYLPTRNMTLHVTSNTGNPGQITLYKNGVLISCSTIPTNDFTNNISQAFFPDTISGDVDISELIILESVPTDNQRESLEAHRKQYFQI